MTPGFPYEEMPPGPAHLWDSTLRDVERLEDAAAQFVNVTVPDLVEDPTCDLDLLYDRLTGTMESLRTAMHALWGTAVFGR